MADDPFKKQNDEKAEIDALYGSENTGINFDVYDDIPVETSGREVPPEIKTFEECNPPLPAALYDNIKRCGYTKPTPVQRYALPIGIAGRDLMACAQVGSPWCCMIAHTPTWTHAKQPPCTGRSPTGMCYQKLKAVCVCVRFQENSGTDNSLCACLAAPVNSMRPLEAC